MARVDPVSVLLVITCHDETGRDAGGPDETGRAKPSVTESVTK